MARAAPVSPVIVVLGANAAEIAPCLDGLPVQIVVNARWDRGMGSSLQAGMQALTAGTPGTKAVIVALADQPDCPADHLARLIEVHKTTGRSIVASTAGEVPGPPVLFTAQWFPRLLALDGESGARRLLQEQPGSVATVPLMTAADLDTPADYERFLRKADRPCRVIRNFAHETPERLRAMPLSPPALRPPRSPCFNRVFQAQRKIR